MTGPDDSSWEPQDDERVRAALLSLMDDVSTQPLPEPESIRARAEGRQVTDLAVHRSRKRSFTVLAGAAAAAVVATTAGLYVANQSPDRPVATSSTQDHTSATSSSTSAATRLTMLDASSWTAILARPVTSTTTATPDGQACFEPTDDASWTRGAPQLEDGSIPARQWIGTARPDSEPLSGAVEAARRRCADQETTERTRGTLADGVAYRGWLQLDPDGTRVWWLEVTSGEGLSFLTVPDTTTRTHTTEDIRRIARAVAGEVDLTQGTTTTSTTSATTGSPTATGTSAAPPTTTVIPPPESSGTGTATPSSTTDPSASVDTARFVPASQWSSAALTGGAPTTFGPLHLEGSPPYIEACISGGLQAPVAATGIRSGPGEDNYFARQYIALASDGDAVRSELLTGYSSGTCPGPAIGGTSTQLTPSIFKLQQGDLTSYIAVVRMQGEAVSVLQLTEAKTAPEPLTDSVAVSELTRMSDLAATR